VDVGLWTTCQRRILIFKQLRQAFALQHIEPAQHFRQRQFVLQVHLIIQICPQPIFFSLPILRHHDYRGLHSCHHSESQVKHLIRLWIESVD
jgi:hypothetical protein